MPFPFGQPVPVTGSWAPQIAAAAQFNENGRFNAAMMDREKEREQQRADEAKQIRAMAKILKDQLGMSPADIESADAATLAGALRGHLVLEDEGVKALQRERDALALAQMKGQGALPGAILDADARRPELSDFYENPEMHPEGRPPGLPEGVRSVLQGFQQSGAPLPPGVMDDLLRLSGRMQPGPINLPPGMVPTSISVGPNGQATTTFGKQEEKKFAPLYPWITGSVKEFNQGLSKITDPEEHALILKERQAWRTATEQSPMQQLLEEMQQDRLGKQSGKPAPAPASSEKPSDRVKVISPDGRTAGTIPRSQLKQAIAEGYTEAK